MAKTEAKKRADNKYDLAHYTVLVCKVKNEIAKEFKEKCKEKGTNPNAVFKKEIERFLSE